MTQSQTSWRAAGVAFFSLFATAALLPSMSIASSEVQNPSQTLRPQRPSLKLVDGQTLRVAGLAGGQALLLFGELQEGARAKGQRVNPSRVIPIGFDLNGQFTLPNLRPEQRVFVQAWQPDSHSADGAFSVPVTLHGPTVYQSNIPQHGDLIVSEFMKDPSAVTDGHGEWIELRSQKAWRMNIEGLTVTDYSGASFTLDNGGLGMILWPGEHYVLGNDIDSSTNGGVPVDYEWSGFSLKNSSDEIILISSGGHTLDVVSYDDGDRWPDNSGMSISLTDPTLTSVQNNDPGLWCSSSTVMGAGPDTGTPGLYNEVCQ
ncbi:MAG: hypothetical protein ACI8X5_004058 [Planctomycetota bacterium]|jgi:hypothetical protein